MIFYVNNLYIYNFNLDSHNNNHIFIIFLKNYCLFFDIHVSRIVS